MQLFYIFAKCKIKINFSYYQMRAGSAFELLITKLCISFVTILFTILPCNLMAQKQSDSSLKLRTVVIDPGHGGKDAGCVSRDRKTYEKNLTLSIAKLLGEKISAAYPDVKVVYTRSTDKYITLNDRAEIANRNHADLFISIHINSFSTSTPNGFSAHILGQSSNKNRDLFSYNMDVCRRENSVILLEDDYTTKYQGFDPNDPESFIFFNLMQNAFYEQSLLFAADVEKELSKGPITHSRGISQDPFYVLWKTTMPAVLIEVGFISNAADLKVMNSSAGKAQIASRLFAAFKAFKTRYDGSLDISFAGEDRTSADGQPAKPAPSSASASASAGTSYGVQILVLSKKLKETDKTFKGYTPQIYAAGRMYKYIVGVSGSEEEARDTWRTVKKKFPDSFPVSIKDGKVSPLQSR